MSVCLFLSRQVVIVGCGKSAMDAAVGASKVAKSVTIVRRRNIWVYAQWVLGTCTPARTHLPRVCMLHLWYSMPWQAGIRVDTITGSHYAICVIPQKLHNCVELMLAYLLEAYANRKRTILGATLWVCSRYVCIMRPPS